MLDFRFVRGGTPQSSREILQRLLNQPNRPRIRIPRAVPLHRKTTLYPCLFAIPNVRSKSTCATLSFPSPTSVSFTCEMLYACPNIASIPRYAYSSSYAASVFAKSGSACSHGLSTFSMTFTKKNGSSLTGLSFSRLTTTFFAAPYSATRFRLSTVRSKSGFAFLRPWNIRPHARRTDRRRRINPLVAERHRAFQLRAVRRIRAVFAVHRHVHDRSARLRHRRAQLLEIPLLQRTEMLAPRFNLLDIEFRADVRREILQLHLPAASLVLPPRHKIPKRIRRNRNPLPRRRRKLHRRGGCVELQRRPRPRIHRKNILQPRPYSRASQRPRCPAAGLRQKPPSCCAWIVRQNRASLADSPIPRHPRIVCSVITRFRSYARPW